MLGRGYGVLAGNGARLKNPSLAKTLRKISSLGSKAITTGPIAKSIVSTSKKFGGTISLDDLKNYKVRYHKPTKINFKGHEIYTASLPSSGGIVLGQMFNLAELLSDKRGQNDIHFLSEIQSLAFETRAKSLGDPAFSTINATNLLSAKNLERLANEYDANSPRVKSSIHSQSPIPTSTTHFSIIDAKGNIVSSTQSINHYFGAGVMAGGIFLNNTLDDFSSTDGSPSPFGMPNKFGLVGRTPNAPAPNKTPLSSMSPTIVFKDSKPTFVLGSPGGPRIISAIFQTLYHAINEEKDLLDAVSTRRFHQQWQPAQNLFREGGFFLKKKLRV